MGNNLSVKMRLIFILGLLCTIAILLSALGLRALGATNDSLRTVYEDRLVALGQLHDIMVLSQQNQIAIAEAVYKESAALPADVAAINQRIAHVSEVWKAYAATYLTAEEKVLAARFAAARARFMQEGLTPALAAMQAGDVDQLRAVVEGPARSLAAPVRASAGELVALQLAIGKAEYAAAQTRYREARILSIGLSLLGIVMGAVIGYWIIRSILQSLGNALQIAEAVAQGDLTQNVAADADNEVGRLVNALQRMQYNLVGIVGGVRSGTDAIATAASQIAAGTQDLSARTEEQASSLEETAASMEELTSTVKENASNAREANQIAETAASVASKGGEEVQAVVETMAAIDASSRKISDIIGTIDGIAFQTNILALNAAVEAARAGEQGRGFAVVATEVRNLAQRSAVAAKEIKQLIADSGEHVALGNKRVASAGATMVQVVDSVRKVTQIMVQITSATAEQSAGIEQVNTAVTQMDQVTQQNAALVEEASAAAEAMEQQAAQLLQSVSVFKLNGAPPAARASGAHAPQLALN